MSHSPVRHAVEAPVTIKAYLMCAFASIGGILFGYDSGYINGEFRHFEQICFLR